MKDRCSHRARISAAKIREIVRYFAADLMARQAASFVVRTATPSIVARGGIEGFWGLAKVRLAKFNGLPKHILICT